MIDEWMEELILLYFLLCIWNREHYLIHKPEPHVLLFRREKDYQTKYFAKLSITLA